MILLIVEVQQVQLGLLQVFITLTESHTKRKKKEPPAGESRWLGEEVGG
jgi:hypothetical protein